MDPYTKSKAEIEAEPLHAWRRPAMAGAAIGTLFVAIVLGAVMWRYAEYAEIEKQNRLSPQISNEQAVRNAADGKARLEKNLAAIAQCQRDMRCLMGGLALKQGSRYRQIQMLDSCDMNCTSAQVSASRLARGDTFLVSQYDEIVFRRFNYSRWKELAVMWSEQFADSAPPER